MDPSTVEALRKKYRGDVRWQQIVKIFFDVDPIGINFETNTDEYDLEATMLMPLIDGGRITTADILTAEIRDVFCQAFGSDMATPGSYRRCADKIARLGLVHSLDKAL